MNHHKECKLLLSLENKTDIQKLEELANIDDLCIRWYVRDHPNCSPELKQACKSLNNILYEL